MVFAKATSTKASIIKSCLDTYCIWSGQAINISKSSILFSKNTDTSTINSIKGFFPFKLATALPKYLGLPFLFGKSKKAAFQDILDKVSGKIDSWRAKTLSQARRTVLIKSTTSSIPSYAMSTFLLPSSITSVFTECLKNFGGDSLEGNLEIFLYSLGARYVFQRNKVVWVSIE